MWAPRGCALGGVYGPGENFYINRQYLRKVVDLRGLVPEKIEEIQAWLLFAQTERAQSLKTG